MTSRPFSSWYFSNFSCGTSSDAGLVPGGLVPACAGALAGDAAGFCADHAFAQASKASKPNDNAFLGRSPMTVSFRYDDMTIRQRTTSADVLKSPAVSLPCF